MINEFENLKPVWWEGLPPFGVARAWDTGRRKWFYFLALVFYIDLDGHFNSRWVLKSELVPRHV